MTHSAFLDRSRLTGISLSILAASSFAASTASAQTATSADLATRRILVEQAEQARQRGDHTRALDLAERAASLQMTPSLRLFIANEQFALHRFVDAMATADVCVREVDRDITVPNRDRVRSECATAQQRARSQIATVVLQLASPRPNGLSVRLGSRVIADVLLGAPIPVDPGEITIAASAPGCEASAATRAVAAGATETIDVALPRCAQIASTSSAATASSSAGPASNGAATTVRDADDPDPLSSRDARTMQEPPRATNRPMSPWPFVVMGVGAVSLGLSGAFFAMRNGAIAPCSVGAGSVSCPDDASLQRALSQSGDAQRFNTLTTATLIGGGVVLAGGVAWLVADRLTATGTRRTERASRAVRVAALPGTIIVGGQF